MINQSELDLKTIEFQKQLIKEALSKCTTDQQQQFMLIYGRVDLIKKDKVNSAYSIIQRTLIKHGEKK